MYVSNDIKKSKNTLIAEKEMDNNKIVSETDKIVLVGRKLLVLTILTLIELRNAFDIQILKGTFK